MLCTGVDVAHPDQAFSAVQFNLRAALVVGLRVKLQRRILRAAGGADVTDVRVDIAFDVPQPYL